MSDEVKDTSLHSDLSAAFDKAETAATTTTMRTRTVSQMHWCSLT